MRYKDRERPIKCASCFAMNAPPDFELTPDTPHYGKVTATSATGFLPGYRNRIKPVAKRDSQHKKLVKHKQPDVRYCEGVLAARGFYRRALGSKAITSWSTSVKVAPR